MRVTTQSAVLAAILLVTTGSSLLGSAAGVQPAATIPTQVIIEFTEKPAAQKISVEGQRVATSGQRVSGAASASAAAAAEHVAFRAASAHIPFKTDHVYIHVSFPNALLTRLILRYIQFLFTTSSMLTYLTKLIGLFHKLEQKFCMYYT